MSILLSAYFPQGIVFAADRNATLFLPSGSHDVEVGAFTKIIPWTQRRAVVGYCGLGELAGLPMDEWMRQFAAKTRDFDSLQLLAQEMHHLVQADFDQDYPPGTDVREAGLIVHLGGFEERDGFPVPSMYYFSNVPGYDNAGIYHDAVRCFNKPTDHLNIYALQDGVQTASAYKGWLERRYQEDRLVWFNNGYAFVAFNLFKDALWRAVSVLWKSDIIPGLPGQPPLERYRAYCAMAIELFGSFFFHHYLPQDRSVGGGVDVQCVPWPERR